MIHFRARRQLIKIAMVCALAIGGSPGFAALVTPERSEIRFFAMQAEVPIDGAFKQFLADIDFDPDQPELAKVNISISLASTDTGSKDADELLVGRDFFDAARFPKASFVASSMTRDGGGKFHAYGQFTLKGRSLPLSIPFSLKKDAAGTWYEGSFPVSRLAFRVGEGEWADVGTLSDRVLIRFKLFVPN